jgi:hypothetical protein
VSIPKANGSFVNFREFVRRPRKLEKYYHPCNIVSCVLKVEVLAKSHMPHAALLACDTPPPPPNLTSPPNYHHHCLSADTASSHVTGPHTTSPSVPSRPAARHRHQASRAGLPPAITASAKPIGAQPFFLSEPYRSAASSADELTSPPLLFVRR